jgi:catechol 2,3-dioxygenase-like lactoylglutathione lyase family enzyme
MSVKPLHHVSLSVLSLDRSIHFYRDLLGMRVSLTAEIGDEAHERYLRLPTGAHGKVAVLQVGRPIGAIQLIEWSHRPNPTPPKRPGDPGLFLLAFELDGESINEVLSRLSNEGIQSWTRPVSTEITNYGNITTAIVEDPDGNMIEFLELPKR